MKLVPCRWSRTGWKYVEAEPSGHKFFGNPNRTNAHGHASQDQFRRGKGDSDFRYKEDVKDAFMTTS